MSAGPLASDAPAGDATEGATTGATGLAALADALDGRAEALAECALRAVYANPFWEERYGARGRRFAAEDGLHHVAYLVEALRAGSPDRLTAYARWLQSVLVARGMCSRHLAENFARLANAVCAEALPEAQPALDYLGAAEDALLYETSDDARAAARAIQEGIARPLAVAAGLATESPASPAYYASYLADAVALGRPDVLADYVRWAAGHLERHGVGPVRLGEGLAMVAERVEALPPPVREVARPALDAARAVVAAAGGAAR